MKDSCFIHVTSNIIVKLIDWSINQSLDKQIYKLEVIFQIYSFWLSLYHSLMDPAAQYKFIYKYEE